MNNSIVRHLRGNGRAASRFIYYSTPQQQSCGPVRRAMTSMRRTSTTPPPGSILTFLSPSPTHSRSAVLFLNELFHLPRVDSASEPKQTKRDCLDELHFGAFSSSWDSVACSCPASGTILHFLSFSADENNETLSEGRVNDIHSPLHLIAVHGSSSSTDSVAQYHSALIECRQRLAKSILSRQFFPQSNLEARVRGMLLYVMCNAMGRHPSPAWILNKFPFTSLPVSPLLDLTPFSTNESSVMKQELDNKNDSNENNDRSETGNTGKLRELALPFFPGVSSLQGKLSKSSLLRPLPGLYQCSTGKGESKDATTKRNTTANPGLIFRPLPAAEEDLRLSPPSLVFQCDSLAEAQKLAEGKLGGRTFKIGWRGHGQLGSLIVSHPSILGLDIRICETASEEWALSSSFDEAQESLLAGSLAELQSAHVVSEGESDGVVKSDTKIGNADCWVEFRSNVKHPTGFLKQFTSSLLQKPARTKVAKPPDLPYE